MFQTSSKAPTRHFVTTPGNFAKPLGREGRDRGASSTSGSVGLRCSALSSIPPGEQK